MRKFWSRLITSYLLVFFTFFSLCIIGCGKKKDKDSKTPEVRVAFWGAVEEKEIIHKVLDDWKKNNPNVNVILTHIPSGSYLDKVLTEIAGGNPPDIIFCEANIFVTFYYKNALLDLTPFLKNDKEFTTKDYYPEILARFTRNGKIYCIPRDVAPFACIFYNKNLFDKHKVPYPNDDWNLDEFLKTAKKLTFDENGKTPNDPGFNEKKVKRYGFWGWSWENFVYSFGGKIVNNVDNPNVCLLDKQPAIDGVQYFIDLTYKYFVSPKPTALTDTGMSVNQLFNMERLAMFQSGIWDTPNLRRTIGDKFKWDVAMFPKGPNGKRGFGTGGSGYAILRTCKHPDIAWKIVKSLAGNNGQEMLADIGLAQPANSKIAEGKYWAQSPKPPANKKMLNRAVKYIVFPPFHPLWKEASDKYITQNMDLIVHKAIPVEEGLKTITKKVNEMLKKQKS